MAMAITKGENLGQCKPFTYCGHESWVLDYTYKTGEIGQVHTQ